MVNALFLFVFLSVASIPGQAQQTGAAQEEVCEESGANRAWLDAISWIYRRFNRIDAAAWVNKAKETGKNQFMGYAVFSADGALLYQSDLGGQVRDHDLKVGWKSLGRNVGMQLFPFHVEYLPQLNRVSVSVSLFSSRNMNAGERTQRFQGNAIMRAIDQIDLMTFVFDDRIENSKLRSMILKVASPTIGMEFPMNEDKNKILYFRLGTEIGAHRTKYWEPNGDVRNIGSGSHTRFWESNYGKNEMYSRRVDEQRYDFPENGNGYDLRINEVTVESTGSTPGLGFHFAAHSAVGFRFQKNKDKVCVQGGFNFLYQSGGAPNPRADEVLRNAALEYNAYGQQIVAEYKEYFDKYGEYVTLLDAWKLEKGIYEFNHGISTPLSDDVYLQVSGADPKPVQPAEVQPSVSQAQGKLQDGQVYISGHNYEFKRDLIQYERLQLNANLSVDWERSVQRPSAAQPVSVGMGAKLNLPVLHQMQTPMGTHDLRRFQQNVFQIRTFIKF